MERSLLIGASALGVVGWVLSVLLARSERDGSPWRLVSAPMRWTALALPIVVFMATLPSKPPFSAGQGLGKGFLIGAVAALLAAFAVVGARRTDRAAINAAVVAAPLWLALPATAIPLLFMRDILMDVLMSVAIGFLCVTAVIYHGLTEDDDRTDTRLTLLSGAGFVAALTAAAAMGAYKGHEIVESSKWAAAAVLAATAVPLSVWIASLPPALLLGPLRKLPGAAAVASIGADVLATDARKRFAAGALRFVLGVGIVALLDWLVANRMLNGMHGLYVSAIGLGVGFLAWWLSYDGAQSALDGIGNHRRPLAVLIALGAVMAAYNLLQGFGITLMCLAVWAPFGLALCEMRDTRQEETPERLPILANVAQSLWSVAAFTAVLAVYRFVATRYDTSLLGLNLTDQYALFGFMAGASIPAIVAGIASPGMSSTSAARLLRLIAAGLLALALPALILILWKASASLALLAGAALAAAGFDWFRSGREDNQNSRLFVPLMALAVCLALAQWTPQALEVSSLTRDQKIGILKWLLGGIAAVLVAVDLGERWKAHKNKSIRREPGLEAAK